MNDVAKIPIEPYSFWHDLWYELIHVGCVSFMTLGFSLRFINRQYMPLHGPALVIANHQSFLDPILCCIGTRRQLIPLARKTLFRNPFFSALCHSLKAIPIDQEGVGKDGIRAISERLKQGHAVLVYPEGSRTGDGQMLPFRGGIHLLLKKAPAPIIPLGIAGAYDAWPKSQLLPIPAPLFLPAGRGTIAVALGEPLDSQYYAHLPREQAMQELFDKVHEVQQLAEKYRRR